MKEKNILSLGGKRVTPRAAGKGIGRGGGGGGRGDPPERGARNDWGGERGEEKKGNSPLMRQEGQKISQKKGKN